MVSILKRGYIIQVREVTMDFKAVKNLAYLTQVAFLMLTPIVLGVYIGNLLDEKFNTSPWFLLLGVLLGVGTAFMSLYKFIMKVVKSSEEDKKKKGN